MRVNWQKYDALLTQHIEAGGDSDGCKWYDHENDMKGVSKRFPDVLFILRGEGEETGDIWVKYFKNGKMQVAKAKIETEEFDLKKLK